ncbi:ANM5 methyltransferase, partial [Polypterus senegalus]
MCSKCLPIIFRQHSPMWRKYRLCTWTSSLQHFQLHTDMDRGDGRTKYLLSGEGAGTIFVIDEYSGNIHVTKSLDREEKAQYMLTAQVVDRQTLRPLEPPSQFIIKVQDINDNPPVFLNGPYTASIPEMANLGTSVIQVTATDADDPTYGNSAKLVYTVLQGQPYFSVDPQTGVVRTAIPSMDRETQDHFVVVLQAKDMGGHMGGLSGTTTITVTLTDVNDNPPKFTQISELAQPLAHVGRVRAEDPDIGENAEVQYAILDEEHSDSFNISAYRGDGLIVLNRPLDFEHRKSYTFRVEATNTHIDPHYLRRGPFKDVTTVKVSVLDADEPPQFSESSYTFNVLENSAAPAIVGHVSAKDPDSGGTAAIRFSIDPRSDPERFFIIGPQDGIISTTTPLDREAALWHNITVVATEVDNPAQSSRIVVSIRIMDINDNPPELEYNYQTAICDTDQPGTLVHVLKAVDRDERGNETQVHFSLAPESRGDQNFTVTDNRVITTLFISLRRQKTDSFTVFEEEDIRENIITYDDEGGGEEDTEAFDIAALQKPDNSLQCQTTKGTNVVRTPHDLSSLDQAPQSAIRKNLSPLHLQGSFTGGAGGEPRTSDSQRKNVYRQNLAHQHSSRIGSVEYIQSHQTNVISHPHKEERGWSKTLPLYTPHSVAAFPYTGRNASNITVGEKGFGVGIIGGYFLAQQDGKSQVKSTDGPTGSMKVPNKCKGFDAHGNYVLLQRTPNAFNVAFGDGLQKACELSLNVEGFLHFRLSQVDNDTSVPPYDSVQIYGFEGQGSLAGSLSSLGSQSEGAVNNVNGDVEADRDAMEDWGPQFEKLAGMLPTVLTLPHFAKNSDAMNCYPINGLSMVAATDNDKREFTANPGKSRPGAQTRSDLLLSGRDWNTLIVGKLSHWIEVDSDIEITRKNSEAALIQELNFAAYLGLPAFMITLRQENNANLARLLLNHIHTGHHSSMFWVRVPLMASEDVRDDVIENDPISSKDNTVDEEKTWMWWHSFRTLCDYNKRICLAIEIGPDLPSDTVIDKWLGEPIKAAVLSTNIFLTNKKGFPVLSKSHQKIIFRLFKLETQFIFTGTNRHSDKEFRSYLQYLEYLNQNRPAPNSYELFSKGYEDYLQSPLQPLMDNLESQTYEVFEKDPIKYSQYQQAVYKCLLDRVPEEQKDSVTQVLMVLGAGRGPLVNASLRAAKQADRKIKVYAVEKNPNAVVTLENWRFEEWGDQVTVVSCDMREWEAPEKADIIVSELLGSFGDNELSPECLDGAQHLLKEDGVSIPCSYTSYLAPISSSKLYNEVRTCREKDRDPEAQFEMPFVVRLHNFHELAEPEPCFTFHHPNKDPIIDNNRYCVLKFPVQCNTVLHGFAGYFETCLYKDVTLSIRPQTHSPGMFSWFPILFPIKQPIPLSKGTDVCVRFWRCNNGKKVWYEWGVTSPVCSAIHNPAGRSYTIGL